jgi:hypothetical protein
MTPPATSNRWFHRLIQWMEQKDQKIIAKWEQQTGETYDPMKWEEYPNPPKTWIRIIPDRETNEPYLVRHYFINLRPLMRIVIHKFEKSDTDGGLHDHPWLFFGSWILEGGYWEHTETGKHWRSKGNIGFYGKTHFHRVELDPRKNPGETWTMFLMGPIVQDWGFKPFGTNDWIQWKKYLMLRKEGRLN